MKQGFIKAKYYNVNVLPGRNWQLIAMIVILYYNQKNFMPQENYPSILLGKAVEQFAILPGIGERSALRMALFLLRQGKQEAIEFNQNIQDFLEKIQFCKVCQYTNTIGKLSCLISFGNMKIQGQKMDDFFAKNSGGGFPHLW